MYTDELRKRSSEYRQELEPISKELEKISVEWMDIRTAQVTYSLARSILGLMTTDTIDTSKFITWLECDLATMTNIRAPGENLTLLALQRLSGLVPAQTLRADIEKEYQYYLHFFRGTEGNFLCYRDGLKASVASLEKKLVAAGRLGRKTGHGVYQY